MSTVARNMTLATLALLSMVPATLGAQARADTIPGDFLALADLRGAIATEISGLERQIREVQDTLPGAQRAAQFAGAYATEARRDSTQLARVPNRTPDQERRLQDAIRYLASVDAGKNAPALLRDSLVSLSKQLAAKKELAGKIQAKIAGLLNPEQHFKRTMSITFAGLIGSVILGFFVLAFKDATVRERVFGGQAGMQFLTLFSLVIAIILFGITGILEGKELAALLGGLSGYILGRSDPGLRQDVTTAPGVPGAAAASPALTRPSVARETSPQAT